MSSEKEPELSSESSSNQESTVKCNNCGSLFPKNYKKCPKCKTLK